MEILRRYCIEGMARCSQCKGVIIGLNAIGGTPDDPEEPEPKVDEPEAIELKPRNVAEAMAKELIDVLKELGLSTEVARGPDGSVIGLSLPHGRIKRSGSSPDWTIELTAEEYESIGSLTIGDVLQVRFQVEKKTE